jgi:hypothetical protein
MEMLVMLGASGSPKVLLAASFRDASATSSETPKGTAPDKIRPSWFANDTFNSFEREYLRDPLVIALSFGNGSPRATSDSHA